MTVRFKLINSVELDRKGRIQYWKTLPIEGLPPACPANLTPVQCFPSDPVTDPVGGVNWTLFDYSGCMMVHPTVANVGLGGVDNGGFPFQVVQKTGQVCPLYTTAGLYNPFPVGSNFCESSLTFDSTTLVGPPNFLSRSIGPVVRMASTASVHHWSGYLAEIVVGINGPNPDQLNLQKMRSNGSSTSIGGVIHPWVHGDLVRVTAANFFAFNEVRVCIKVYINGALVITATDFGGSQFTIGGTGFAILSSLAAQVDNAMNSRELDVTGWTSCVDVVS